MEPENLESVQEDVMEDVPKVDPKIEERAKLQGWVPLDGFKGDKERWISADEFVKRADTVMPILKSQNKKLEDKLLNLSKELQEQKDLSKKMIKIHGKYTEDAYNDRINTIRRLKSDAVELGDVDKYKQLEAEESKIPIPEKIEIDESPIQAIDPGVLKWQEENAHWYGNDKDLTEYTDIIAEKMGKSGHNFTPYQFCEEVKKRVKTMFPEKFNGAGNISSGVDEPGTRGSDTMQSKKGKTWNDLPKDAKEQCSSLMGTIQGYTKEKYLRDYFEGE